MPPTDRELHVGLVSSLPPSMGGVTRWAERFLAAAPGYGLRVTGVDNAPPGHFFNERSKFSPRRAVIAGRMLADVAGLVFGPDRPDVVHVNTSLFWATPRDAAVLALCRAAGVPTVLHVHGSTHLVAWRAALPPWRRQLLDRVLGEATALVVLAREIEAILTAALPGQRIRRVGNMVELEADPARDPYRRAPLLPPPTRPRVLFVAIRTPLKGLAELAEAVLELPDVELVAVGGPGGALDPVQARRMEAALGQLAAEGRLVDVGAQTPEQVLRLYREADVFALPSYREGLPNVLLEAMAAGLPCVVTPVGGIPDAVGRDGAILVPVGEVPPLRAALRRLVDDPSLRSELGERGRAIVGRDYSIEAVMTQLRALYDAVVPRK